VVKIYGVSERQLLQTYSEETTRSVRLAWSSRNTIAVGRQDGVLLALAGPNGNSESFSLRSSISADHKTFTLSLTAPAERTTTIQRSAELYNWTDWSTYTSTGEEKSFDFPLDSGSYQFFRATLR